MGCEQMFDLIKDALLKDINTLAANPNINVKTGYETNVIRRKSQIEGVQRVYDYLISSRNTLITECEERQRREVPVEGGLSGLFEPFHPKTQGFPPEIHERLIRDY